MNDFVHAIDGFNQHKVYYTDTDSLFIKRSDLNLLKEKGYFGKNPFQGKNDTNKPEYFNCKQLLDINVNTDLAVKLNKDIIDNINTAKQCMHNCTHLHRYVPENEIVKYASCGPKQKIIVVKDTHSDYTKELLTLKGVPNTVAFTFEQMKDIITNNTSYSYSFNNRLKKSLNDGISTCTINKTIANDKYLNKMTLVDNMYIPIHVN